jgi:tetratricopeptide (TPR) repeat protein
VVGAIILLGVVGGGGFGGYQLLIDGEFNAPTLDFNAPEFAELPDERKAEQLDQALEAVGSMPLDQLREMRREVELLKNGESEAVDVRLRDLQLLLEFYGDDESEPSPQKASGPTDQSNAKRDNTSNIKHVSITRRDHAFVPVPSKLLLITAAMMGYQPAATNTTTAVEGLEKKIEELSKDLERDVQPALRAAQFHKRASVREKLARSISSTHRDEAIEILATALKDCSEAVGLIRKATGKTITNPELSVKLFQRVSDTKEAIQQLQFSLQLESQAQSISDQLKAVQDDVMNVRTQVNDVSGNLRKTETELAQTTEALEKKVTGSDGEIDTLKKELKATSDLVTDPDTGLASAKNDITDVKVEVAGTVAQRQEIEKLYRSGIKDFFSLHRLDERLKLARPQPAGDDADDAQKAAAEEDVARWVTDKERIEMLAGRLDTLDELVGPGLVADYQFLRSVQVQVTQRENERLLQEQIAALPTPATPEQIAASKEVAAQVVSIIRTQITDENGALKDVKRLADIKLPAKLIGQPAIEKMITDAMAELSPPSPGGTTPGTKPGTGVPAVGVTNARLKALQTLLEKRLMALRSDVSESITETQKQLTDKVSTDLAAQQKAATTQRTELTKTLNDNVTAVDLKVSAESKRRDDQVRQVQETLEQKIQQAVLVPHPLPDDQLKGITANTVAATIRQLAKWGYSLPTLPPEPTESTTAENKQRATTLFEEGYHTFFSRRPDADKLAIRQFSEAVQFDGNDPLFRYYLGLALRCDDQHEEALKQIQIGARLEKRHGGTNRIVARLDRIQFATRKWLDRIRRDVMHR